MTILNICMYAASASFASVCIFKGIKIAKAPAHLRWELYPVPHEKGKASYGGSKAEEPEFWNKNIKKNHLGELTYMAKEIFLLHGVYKHNKDLWQASFPLHFGLYLVIANIMLVALSAILAVAGIPFAPNPTGIQSFLMSAIPVVANIAGALGTVGAISMLYKRVFDEKLAAYSNPSHYFNLIILAIVFITGLFWFMTDADFAQNEAQFFVSCLNGSEYNLPTIAYWHISFFMFFMMYMPLTHMAHFFTKYFTFHKVRWDDEENVPGSKMQKKIQAQLNQKVTWSAPHIGADGEKTWLVIASEKPAEVQNGK